MSTKRILIFNVNWLGDVLFSTATIRNIRLNFPDSFIACVVPQRCASILEGNPHLNEIITFDERKEDRGVLKKLRFVRALKRRRFDTVFLLHRSLTRALMCYMAGIKERIGYDANKRGFLLTTKITAPERDTLHRIDYYLTLIEKAGLKVKDRYLEIFVNAQDTGRVSEFLAASGAIDPGRSGKDLLVAVNPGGNWFPKRWPEEYWARLSDMLIRDYKAKVIITGAPADKELVDNIAALMEQKPIVACGILDVKQLAALCKKVDFFITADTGPLHIASAVQAKRIIALFGPTSVRLTGPYPAGRASVLQKDVGCVVPCYTKDCADSRCMKAIKPEEVIAEIFSRNVSRA